MNYVKWLIALSLAATFYPVYADGMRCGTKLVMAGDSKAEVLQKCGEPQFQETIKLLKENKEFTFSNGTQSNVNTPNSQANVSSQEQNTVVLGTESIEAVEQWTYDPGFGQFLKILTFRAGKLETVSDGDRSQNN